MINRIQKFLQRKDCEWQVVYTSKASDGRVIVMECTAPVKAIRFVAAVPKGPVMTEEQKKANAERLRSYQTTRNKIQS